MWNPWVLTNSWLQLKSKQIQYMYLAKSSWRVHFSFTHSFLRAAKLFNAPFKIEGAKQQIFFSIQGFIVVSYMSLTRPDTSSPNISWACWEARVITLLIFSNVSRTTSLRKLQAQSLHSPPVQKGREMSRSSWDWESSFSTWKTTSFQNDWNPNSFHRP